MVAESLLIRFDQGLRLLEGRLEEERVQRVGRDGSPSAVWVLGCRDRIRIHQLGTVAEVRFQSDAALAFDAEHLALRLVADREVLCLERVIEAAKGVEQVL